jgi:hypothetical protein
MIYSVILKNYSLVSDFSEDEGDFQEVLIGILKANKKHTEFYCISYMNYDFYFLHKDEYTFSCIAGSKVDEEKVLLFLNTLKQSFYDMYQREKENFTLKITNIMRDLMEHYKENVANDKFDKIERELKEIEKDKAEILRMTIDKEVVLDSLIDKSEKLKQTVS